MQLDPSLGSYKRGCEADFGSPIQSGGRTFRNTKKFGRPSETFLLAKTLIGHQQVYQILHCLHHFQVGHQEAKLIHPSVYF
jgi:hypothetical protein